MRLRRGQKQLSKFLGILRTVRARTSKKSPSSSEKMVGSAVPDRLRSRAAAEYLSLSDELRACAWTSAQVLESPETDGEDTIEGSAS